MSTQYKGEGLLLVIAASSGTGKSTVCQELLTQSSRCQLSVSYTTRPPRNNEKDGEHYHFVSKETFEGMIERQEFLEWAKVHDNYYGTSRLATEQAMAQGRDILLDIDVQGARQIRELHGKNSILIFLLPPSWDVMVQRLRGRGTESEERIQRRLKTAREEIPTATDFDYIVENDDLTETVKTIQAICRSERHSASRMGSQLQSFLTQIPPLS
ncbi:MAG: guanylate kinase [Myxococcales bacterium]|nr:guanylate kinase [Myxococcales bacterium]MCB9644112.1 guanylate kinase [Myxococcales bacterium]